MKNIVTILALILVAALLAGCTGAQAVPGATCTFSFVKSDGTKVTFTSDKDTSADSVTFDPTTGQIAIVKLNSNGSNIAGQQLAAIIQQSIGAAILGQTLPNAALAAFGKAQQPVIVPPVVTTQPAK